MSPRLANVVAACAARLGADATPVLSRLGGALGEDARAASRELLATDDAARQRRRAEVLAIVRSPVIRDARGVHPTWLEAALALLPGRARTAITGGSSTAIDVWLARWVAAELPIPAPPVPAQLVAISAFDAQRLEAWLAAIALDQLAFALGAAAATAPALGAAVMRIAQPPRRDGLGPQRAAIVRCRGARLDDPIALVAIAARALAPHLAPHPYAALVLSRRLPRRLGSVLERELTAHAATSLAEVPIWSALAS